MNELGGGGNTKKKNLTIRGVKFNLYNNTKIQSYFFYSFKLVTFYEHNLVVLQQIQ